MKKGIVFALSFLAFAGLVNATDNTVGVNITGNTISYDVVTTITADINYNPATNQLTPAAMVVKNNGQYGVNVKITDIESLTEGAPSEFVEYDVLAASKYGVNSTKTKIGFAVSEGVKNTTKQTIYPISSTEHEVIDLGDICSSYGMGAGSDFATYNSVDYTFVPKYNYKVYELYASLGKLWETDQRFEYNITTVVSLAEDDCTYSKEISPNTLGIDFVQMLVGTDSTGDKKLVRIKLIGSNLALNANNFGNGKDYYMNLRIGNNVYLYSTGNVVGNTTFTQPTFEIDDAGNLVIYADADFTSDDVTLSYLPVELEITQNMGSYYSKIFSHAEFLKFE